MAASRRASALAAAVAPACTIRVQMPRGDRAVRRWSREDARAGGIEQRCVTAERQQCRDRGARHPDFPEPDLTIQLHRLWRNSGPNVRVVRYTAGGGEHATPGDAIRRQSGSVLGQSFETGPQLDRCTASASSGLISGQSFETLEALIWGPPGFVPKLTAFGTSSCPAIRITP